MRKNVFILAAAALLFAGCAKEVAEQFETASYNTTISAVIDGVDTKAALADEGTFTWQEGDKIAVYTSKNAFKTFTLTDGAGTNKAHFGGDLADDETVTGPAVYPAALAPEFVSATKVKVTLPETYTYEGAQTNVPMTGTLAESVLTFKQVGGVVKFSVTGIPDDAAKLVVSAKAASLTGTYRVSYGSTIVAQTAETSMVTINFTKTGDAMDFYLPVPTGTFKNLAVSLRKADDSVISEKTSTADNVIARGTLMLMPAISLSGDGNIATADQLIALLTQLDKTLSPGTYEAAIAYTEGKTWQLVADIDLAGKTVPTAAGFKGTLDGNGHTIKNITAMAPLFATLAGTVKNVTFEGSFTQAVEGDDAATVGHPFAVLANVSTGSVKNVTNKASVTMTSTKVVGSPVVAGLVAFQKGGTFKGNKNFGAVSVTHAGTKNVAITGFTRKPFVVTAGVVGVIEGATAEECENEGNVSVACTKVPAVEARHYIGGVVGTPENARVLNCINKGKVTGDFTDATKAAAKQVWVGGVIGGRNGDVKTVDGAYVEGCKNYGECTLVAENAVNNYLAGIAGQCTVEAKGTNYTAAESTIQKLVNCQNYGKLVKKGAGGCRLGGIHGGAATLENCTNEGEIVVEGISTAGAVGGLVGYPTQPYHPVTGCKNYGNMTATCDVAFVMGGLFGQGGNTNQAYEDCAVNCTMTAPASVKVGIILGTAHTIASGKSIVYGTAEKPFKVKGSVNGTALTAENFTTLLLGNSTTAGGVINTDNVLFDGVPVQFSEHLADGYFIYDNKKYNVVKLADGKWWMAAPLAYVPAGKTVSADDKADADGIWYTYTSDGTTTTPNTSNTDAYLYNAVAAFGLDNAGDITFGTRAAFQSGDNVGNFRTFEGTQGICPPGWYIPTRSDFLELVGNSNKDDSVGETKAYVDKTAWYWVEACNGSSVKRLNEAGWNFSFLGVRGRTNNEAEAQAANNNRMYIQKVTTAATCSVSEWLGKPSTNQILSSTPYMPNAAGNNVQYFCLSSTFTGSYKDGRLNVMYTNYLQGVEVRCVRKVTE